MIAKQRSWRQRLAGVSALSLAIITAACSSPPSASTQSAAAGQAIGQPSVVLSGNLATVSCGASGFCAAGGSSFEPTPTALVLMSSSDAGTNWVTPATPIPPTTSINDLACSAKTCLAVGFGATSAALYGKGSSGSWSTSTLPAGVTPQAVSCVQERWCLMIGSSSGGTVAQTTIHAGAKWSSPVTLPAGIGQVLSVSCSTIALCITTGISPTGQPQVLFTTSGMSGWQLAVLPTGLSQILSASCSSTLECLVVTKTSTTSPGALMSNSPGSTTFSTVAAVGNVENPASVSCLGKLCAVGGATTSGQGTVAFAYGGVALHKITMTYVPTSIIGLSCISSSACVGITTSSLVQIAVPPLPQQTTTS